MMSLLIRILTVTTLVTLTAATVCGAAEESSAKQLFGFGQGYFHPSLKIATEYTDNYKQEANNEQSDWQTTVSPGFWVSLPATKTKQFSIVSSNAAPGGQGVSRFQDAGHVGFSGSLAYNADILRSHDHSDEDVTKHRGQGVLQYTFANGLSLELADVYVKSAEEYAETQSDELEKFNSNLFNAIAFYQYSPKLKLRLGYSNFDLEYTSGTDVDFKERTDNQLSSYVIYRVLPKTELFAQYDYIDIDYDQDILPDAEDQHFFVGVKFDSTARISGHAKLGYGHYDADLDRNGTFEDFIGSASLKYGFWEASSVTLSALQRVNITDEKGYANVLHSEVGLALAHKLSHKMDVTVQVTYKEDEYRVDDNDSGREDEDWVVGVRTSYTLMDWLKFGVNYTYTDRDSNEASNSYEENKLMFSLAAAF